MFISFKAAKRKLMSFVQRFIKSRQRAFVLWWYAGYRVWYQSTPALNSHNSYCITSMCRNTMQTARSPDLSSSRNQTPIIWTKFSYNTVGFSSVFQTGTGTHPDFYTMDSGSFPRGKAAGAWLLLPTPSSIKVEEKVELNLLSPLGLHGLL
jgi:hypothetical protein